MIKVLPQSLINKIAAGEVVERPASVVKELIENALDAGAKTIAIEIEKGGKQSIVVRDDGSGIEASDLPLCITPHATSKISVIEDLYTLTSFGFRGEALSAIASVCDFSVVSKTEDALQGYELKPGEELKPIAARTGTCVRCKNLFHTIPARQKFLKADATEFSHILGMFVQFALINPGVGFSLMHNGKSVHQLGSTHRWNTRIEELLGRDFVQNSLKVDFKTRLHGVQGLVSTPRAAEIKPKHQHIFINHRPVRDYLILKACKQGLGSLIMEREQPNVVLDLWIDPGQVDVNVHPRKLEVKHENPGDIFAFTARAVSRAVSASSFSAEPDTAKKSMSKSVLDDESLAPAKALAGTPRSLNFSQSKSNDPTHGRVRDRAVFSYLSADSSDVTQETLSETTDADSSDPLISADASVAASPPRILGQLHHSYIVIESEQGLLLVDQHAAHERINYENLSRQMEASTPPEKQALLVPATVEFSVVEKDAFEANRETLIALGFEIEPFGGETFVITATPAMLKIHNPVTLLKEVLTDFSKDGETRTPEEKYKKIIDMIACKSAVRFGDALTLEEQQGLIARLEKTPNNQSCTHGRPVSYFLTLDELAKIFKRK